jgi:hypothetical protein
MLMRFGHSLPTVALAITVGRQALQVLTRDAALEFGLSLAQYIFRIYSSVCTSAYDYNTSTTIVNRISISYL